MQYSIKNFLCQEFFEKKLKNFLLFFTSKSFPYIIYTHAQIYNTPPVIALSLLFAMLLALQAAGVAIPPFFYAHFVKKKRHMR